MNYKARNREFLVTAALAEFAEVGYVNASVERIAERAGFTKGAFYSNFESKQEALHQVLEEYFVRENERVLAKLDAVAGFDASAEALGRLIDELYGAADLPRILLAIEFQLMAARDPAFAKLYDKLFTRQIAGARRSAEAIFRKAGKQAPKDLDSVTAGLIALAHALLLQAARGSNALGSYSPGSLYTVFLRLILASAEPLDPAPLKAPSIAETDVETRLMAAVHRLSGESDGGRRRLLHFLEQLEIMTARKESA